LALTTTQRAEQQEADDVA